MTVHSLVEGVCGPSWTYMHWGSSGFPADFVIPLMGASFGHCLGLIHSLVPVEYWFSLTCLLYSYPTGT